MPIYPKDREKSNNDAPYLSTLRRDTSEQYRVICAKQVQSNKLKICSHNISMLIKNTIVTQFVLVPLTMHHNIINLPYLEARKDEILLLSQLGWDSSQLIHLHHTQLSRLV